MAPAGAGRKAAEPVTSRQCGTQRREQAGAGVPTQLWVPQVDGGCPAGSGGALPQALPLQSQALQGAVCALLSCSLLSQVSTLPS